MGDFDRLPSVNPVPPTRPVPGGGSGNQAPQRKPETGERDRRQQRRRRPDDDDVQHIDEYA